MDYKKFLDSFQLKISSIINEWENSKGINLEYFLFYVDDRDIINFLDSGNTVISQEMIILKVYHVYQIRYSIIAQIVFRSKIYLEVD